MIKKVKTALASFGMSGQVFHGPSLKVNPGFEVVRVLERSKAISAEMFPEAEITRSYGEILKDAGVELVIVNTPDKYHFDMAREALLAGKHVVVEKPAAHKSKQVQELLSLAKERGVMYTIFQNRRWDGDFMTVKKVIEQGVLGRLVEFEAHYDRFRNVVVPDSWKEEGGEHAGVLYNLGSHMADQVFVLFGKPLTVSAFLKKNRDGGRVTDYYDIRLEYDGFMVILKSSLLVKEPGPRYSIHGSAGSFHKWGIDPQEEMLKAGHLPAGPEWGKEPASEWGTLVYEQNGITFRGKVETLPGNYNAFYDNIYDVLRKGAELAVKPEETVEVLRILEACLTSHKEKRTVVL